MTNINSEISMEVLKKASACKTPEELVALGKSEGVTISLKEAESPQGVLFLSPPRANITHSS